MEINKLSPDLCKYESCLQKADYEFTDVENEKSLDLQESRINFSFFSSIETSDITKPGVQKPH